MARTTPNRKTPGVYITELEAFPRSIVGVDTAIPAFIGYTETAKISGKPVYGQPVKLTSLVDYETIFGAGYKPLYDITELLDDSEKVKAGKFDFSLVGYENDPPYGDDNEPGAASTKYYELTQVGSTKFALYDSMRLFFANGGGTCYVVSVGSYMDGSSPRTISDTDLLEGLTVIGEEVGPTMLVVPDAVLLSTNTKFKTVVEAMLKQAKELQDRVAILDVYDTEKIGTKDANDDLITRDAVIDQFREDLATLTTVQRSYGAAYFPFLRTTVWHEDEVDYTNINNQDVLSTVLGYQNATLNWNFSDAEATATYTSVQDDIDATATATTEDEITEVNQNLTASLPLLGDIDRVVIYKNEVAPPSGAMAGQYTANDQNKGVWNAPANVSLSQVHGLTYRVDNDTQGNLNVPVNGMSVAAIREFPGRGQVVWGARTLDGNSPDNRYIQVRRTLIYIEQSVKKALDPFVFAANDGKTWAAVIAMVSGFLQTLWNQGGLFGASAADAYTVECGLGSTMTGQDILDGYMIVNVTLQLIRPAEFIELTFKQRMNG